jgi:hypothetical protein
VLLEPWGTYEGANLGVEIVREEQYPVDLKQEAQN